MNTHIKQRLIGLLVFLLLGAILAPVLFRSPEQVRVALDLQIPDQPELDIAPPAPVVSSDEVERVREQIGDAREEVVEAAEAQAERVQAGEPDPEAAPSEPFTPTGWVVQVASFTDRSNAVSLQTRLQAADYNAFVRDTVQDEVTYYRVFAGPEIKRAEASALLNRLGSDPRFKLNGLLLPYTL
jgi:DedD protein